MRTINDCKESALRYENKCKEVGFTPSHNPYDSDVQLATEKANAWDRKWTDSGMDAKHNPFR